MTTTTTFFLSESGFAGFSEWLDYFSGTLMWLIR
jgi:hypothetical protein